MMWLSPSGEVTRPILFLSSPSTSNLLVVTPTSSVISDPCLKYYNWTICHQYFNERSDTPPSTLQHTCASDQSDPRARSSRGQSRGRCRGRSPWWRSLCGWWWWGSHQHCHCRQPLVLKYCYCYCRMKFEENSIKLWYVMQRQREREQSGDVMRRWLFLHWCLYWEYFRCLQYEMI